MANFKPLKLYMFWLADKLVRRYKIRGPMLDAGGGIGDTILHFAQKGFKGKLIDFSEDATKHAKKILRNYDIIVENKNILNERSKYNFIICWDVLEHIENDKEVIDHLYSILNAGGYLLVSFPVKMKEWRCDDNRYGHLRRYEMFQIKKLFSDFRIILIWDFTFPIFWLLRRLYVNFTRKNVVQSKIELTKRSSLNFNYFRFFNKYLSNPTVWKPLWHLCYLFKNHKLGGEFFILLRKQ